MKPLKRGMMAPLLAIMLTLLLAAQAAEAAPLSCGTWSVVSSPNAGAGDNTLTSVATVSASNIWAVGSYPNSSGINQTLIEHWNGTKWNIVSSPNVGTGENTLNRAAASAGNIWAVGYYRNNSGVVQTLTEFYC